MTLLFLNNPKAWGYLVLFAFLLIGFIIGMASSFIFRRRLFFKAANRQLETERADLLSERSSLQSAVSEYQAEVAILYATQQSMKIKALEAERILRSIGEV